MSGRGNAIFIVGLCVLAFALVSSFLATAGTIGEEWRTVGILTVHPKDIGQWVRYVLTLGVLPIAAGLVLVITPFILQENTRTRQQNLFCLLCGGFFAAWGTYYFLATYNSYAKALNWASQLNVTNITDSLNGIYIGYGCIAALWLTSGIFLSVTSVCARNTQQLDSNESRGRLLRQ